ncbi:MAG: hypothetical protein GWN12_10655, partial [Thermoplasmata archaeon]|nr:hypothetical protein [Thermoplasmata archaeon]NIW89218.1 hypothetical protein [Thermoplasmata archaeon]
MAVMFVGMLMRLVPLTEFSLWGSDWGEYFHLTERLVEDGHHLELNLGWGRAYVDFTGLFDLTGAVALITGLSVSDSMLYVIPCVTAISCLLVACIVLRLGGGPWAALISATLVAVIFPEVFTNSHPVPGPLGSTILLGTILVFLMGDAWRSDEGVDAERPMVLHVLFMLLLLALMVTHHMSHFFLVLVLGMAYLLRNAMVFGREPRRDWWGIWTLISALALATVYWLVVAKTFRDEVMVDLVGVDGYVMMALGWVALLFLMVIAAGIGRYRRRVPNPPMWGVPELGPALVAYFVAGFVIIFLVSVYGFPGTDIEPGGEMIVYILPTVAAFALLIGSSDVVLRRHGGIVAVAWVAALTGSFLLMTALQSHILVPYRHIPYLVEGMAVLAGIGAIHLIVMFRPRDVTRARYMAPLVIIGVLLLASLAYTAYPPKSVMGGFQEGTTEQELGASLWLRGGLPVPGGVPEDLGS